MSAAELLFIGAGYAACVCLASVLCFPAARTRFLRTAGRLRRSAPVRVPAAVLPRARVRAGAGLLFAAGLPPLLVWIWAAGGGGHAAPGAGKAAPANAHVAALLYGERLHPPQALPPLLFQTAEARLERPLLGEASRTWGALDPAFAQKLLLVFKLMRERHGYEMTLLEGYRSPERQRQLAAAGPHVTHAGAFQSYHQYGMAADCAFVREGRLVITEKDPWAMQGYALYGQVAEEVGLQWGGRWTLRDFGHTELRGRGARGGQSQASG